MKARTMVLADSWIRIGMPVASGATFSTAEAKRAIVSLSFWLPLGRTSTRARPSLAIQSWVNSFGRLSSETLSGWRLERIC